MRWLACLALAAGCYRTDPRECAITCGAEAACPEAMVCREDGYCHGEAHDESCIATGGPDAPLARADAPSVCEARLRQISMGYSHSCGLAEDGALWCWGQNDSGQLGETSGDDPIPRRLPVWPPAMTQVAAGFHEVTCVLAAGRARCAGQNDQGQLGDGTLQPSAVPVDVAGLTGADQLSAGGPFACARLGGGLSCWGGNLEGQLGTGDLLPRPSATAVPGVGDASDVCTGFHHTCALRGGAVWCWGHLWGNGRDASTSTPAAIVGLTGVSAMSCGLDFNCAVTQPGGEVQCFGACTFGQCGGDPTIVVSLSPIRLALGDAVAISAGSYHACAVLADGSVWCWGRNDHGQLGSGGLAGGPLPVQVRGLTDAVQVEAGEFASCAVRRDGTAMCWGENDRGQLGDGTFASALTPVNVGVSCSSP